MDKKKKSKKCKKSIQEKLHIGPRDEEMQDRMKKGIKKKGNGSPVIMIAAGDFIRKEPKKSKKRKGA